MKSPRRSGKQLTIRCAPHVGLVIVALVLVSAVIHAQMTAIPPDQLLTIPAGESKTAQQWLSELSGDRQALAAYPDSAKAHGLVGRDLHALGETDAASQMLDRALELDPHLTDALVEKGSILAGRSEWIPAIDLFRRAVAISPRDASAHLWLGDMLLRTGDFDGAFDEFKVALSLEPKSFRACQGMGLVHLQQGNFSAAIDDFHQALAIKANYLDGERGLAHAFASAHNWPEVKECLIRVLEADPDSPSDTDALGTALARMGNKADAEKQFARARELSNNELLLLRAKGDNNWGVTLRRENKKEEAAAAFRRALEDDSHFCEAHDNLGGVLWMLKDVAAAMSEFQAAVRCDPSLASAHNNLGTALLYFEHNQDGAIAQFHAALILQPGFAMAHLNLGKALASRQDLTEAEPEFRSAIIIDPNLAAAHVGLGLLLAMKKNDLSAEAKEELLRGLRLDPALREIIPQSYRAQLSR